MATINFSYPEIFENFKTSISTNFDYYTTKIQDLITEIANLKDNITQLRRRIIQLEDAEKINKTDIKQLKDEFNLIKINL